MSTFTEVGYKVESIYWETLFEDDWITEQENDMGAEYKFAAASELMTFEEFLSLRYSKWKRSRKNELVFWLKEVHEEVSKSLRASNQRVVLLVAWNEFLKAYTVKLDLWAKCYEESCKCDVLSASDPRLLRCHEVFTDDEYHELYKIKHRIYNCLRLVEDLRE